MLKEQTNPLLLVEAPCRRKGWFTTHFISALFVKTSVVRGVLDQISQLLPSAIGVHFEMLGVWTQNTGLNALADYERCIYEPQRVHVTALATIIVKIFAATFIGLVHVSHHISQRTHSLPAESLN